MIYINKSTADNYDSKFFTVETDNEVGFHQDALEPYCDQSVLPPNYEDIYRDLQPDYGLDEFVTHVQIMGDAASGYYNGTEHQDSLVDFLRNVDTGCSKVTVPLGVKVGPYMLTPSGVKTYAETVINIRGCVVDHDPGLGGRWSMCRAIKELEGTCEPGYHDGTLIITNRKGAWYEVLSAHKLKYLKVTKRTMDSYADYQCCVVGLSTLKKEYECGPMREFMMNNEEVYCEFLRSQCSIGQYVSMHGVKWRRVIVDSLGTGGISSEIVNRFVCQNLWLYRPDYLTRSMITDCDSAAVIPGFEMCSKLTNAIIHSVCFFNVSMPYNIVNMRLTSGMCYRSMEYSDAVSQCRVSDVYKANLLIDKPKECLVCFGAFELLTDCGHGLCKQCAERVTECPNCRASEPEYIDVSGDETVYTRMLDCVRGRTVVWSSYHIKVPGATVLYEAPTNLMHDTDTLIYYGMQIRQFWLFVNMRRKKHLQVYVFN